MSDEKNKVTDKAGEMARNIWLAGIGAYGKAVEDAQGRIEKAMEPPKLFKDLVKVGSALEEDAREALESTAQARQSVEERINKVRENFQMQRPARIEDIAALERRVESLARQVKALTKALEEQGLAVKPKRKPAEKKQKATRKPAKRKARTTNKKAPAKAAAQSRSNVGAKKIAATKKKTATSKRPAASKKAATKRKNAAKSNKAKPKTAQRGRASAVKRRN